MRSVARHITMLRNTDRNWEKFGREDPYFGVFTHERFRRGRLDEATREEFFASGRDYVDGLIAGLAERHGASFPVARALDFGCGVGRLLIPLAAHAREVTGVDVSPSMLAEARRNLDERGIDNAVLVESDDSLSRLTGHYDLIHSFIVFQHIPVARGRRLYARLLEHLAPGGTCVAHFTFARDAERVCTWKVLAARLPLVGNLVNLARGRGFAAPRLEMNAYDLDPLLFAAWRKGARDCHLQFTAHGGHVGAVLAFRVPS